MPRRSDLVLDRDRIAEAGLALFREGGLAAVSTRKVAAALGASPMSLYVHVGSKQGLLDAIVERLMRGVKVDVDTEADWQAQAGQWAHGLRVALLANPDVMALLQGRRWAFVHCTAPLMRALLAAGFSEEEAVRGVRLLVWSTLGFLGIESGVERLDASDAGGHGAPLERSLSRLRSLEGAPGPAADARGVDQRDIDALFALQTRFVIEGLARAHRA